MNDVMLCVGGMFQGDCYSAVFRESDRLQRPFGNHAYVQIGIRETGMVAGESKPAVLVFDRATDRLLYGQELDIYAYTGWKEKDRVIQEQQITDILDSLSISAHK